MSTHRIHHKNLLRLATVLLLWLQGSQSYSQTAPITFDELFNDWDASLSTYTDGADNPNHIDFLDMQVTNDDQYLYIKLHLDTALSLPNSSINHDIWLSIDTDNDPTTGHPEQTGYGVELAIHMKNHYAWFNTPNPNVQVTFGAIGLQTAPTVTSSTIEIAIPRVIQPDSVHDLFSNDTIRILFKDELGNDRMPDIGSVYSYTFDNSLVHTATPTDIAKAAPEHIRVVSYNILFNNGFSASAIDHMERVVTTLNGDLYCFQECTEDTTNIRNYFNNWIPLIGGQSWHVGKGGGRVTVSKWPMVEYWNLSRKTAHLIEVPDSIALHDMLLINGHLSCCANDAARQSQVDDFASFILDAKTPGGIINLPDSTPMVFVGDMNLVGFAQQYYTVITGDIQDTLTYGPGGFLDWDNTELADARPLHVDSNFVYTWRDLQGDGFPPGRLDYQFFTDAVLSQEKAFILDTERMSPSQLATHNLQQEDTRRIADHLPVVVDYTLVEQAPTVGLGTPLNRIKPSITVYPNPTTDVLNFETTQDIVHVVVYDLMGQMVLEDFTGAQRLNLPQLSRGVYVVKVTLRNQQPQHIRVIAGRSTD